MIDRLPAEGFILCGGESERFGGVKARYPIGGHTLIERLFQLLGTIFSMVTIVCKREEDFRDLGLPCIGDKYGVRAPLAGVLTALECSHSDWNFLAACDLPNLTEPFIRWLWQQKEGLGVIPATAQHLHPLAAFYHRDSLSLFMTAYDRGEYSLRRIIDRPEFVTVPVEDAAVLLNVNRPDDLGTTSRDRPR